MHETLGMFRGAGRVWCQEERFCARLGNFRRSRGLSTAGARSCDPGIMILHETLDRSKGSWGQGQQLRFCVILLAVHEGPSP